ncbi:MAG: hypothetical protein C0606_11455 [Hyphomicrobiales bacterium]|mgnify:CR=1 FL=1|nr:MAG: hypothetical protein C0606_11455 [Hyphomicrobiales bacterium]
MRILTTISLALLTALAAPAFAGVAPSASTQRPVATAPAQQDGLIRVAAARKYFVVLGSFRSRGAANQRCSMFGDGYVVSTNDYPNFRNGYWACVIGPLSRGEADDQMWASKEAVPDAYVKAGW